MINDEQRREVASLLRKEADSWAEDCPDTVSCESYDYYEFILRIANAANIDLSKPPSVLFDRLADLIDRPTCHDTKDKHGKAFTCSRCGFSNSTLVFDPFAIEFIKLKPNYHHCPNCGAEIID